MRRFFILSSNFFTRNASVVITLLIGLGTVSSALAQLPPYYVAMSLGRVSAVSGGSDTLPMYRIEGNTLNGQFDTTSATSALAYSVEGGVTFTLNPRFQVLTGLALTKLGNETLSGDYYFNGDTSSDGAYQYKLGATYLLAKATTRYLVLPQWPAFALVAEVGLGYGRVSTSDFSIDKVSQLDPPSVSTGSVNHMVYQYGLGADYTLTPNWIVGLGYDVVHVGEGELHSTPADGLAGTLRTGAVQVSTLSARVRYQF